MYPHEIGGRDLALSQIGCSLTQEVRDAFEINKVPQDIAWEVNEPRTDLSDLEDRIYMLIDKVRATKGNQDFLKS